MTGWFAALDRAALDRAALDRCPGYAAIGVDVGGTKTAFGLLDGRSLTLVDRRAIATSRDLGGEVVLRDIAAQAGELADQARHDNRELTGIGVAVPEIVTRDGRISSGAVIPRWDELPVAATLATIAPVHVEADVRAAAFAEATLGAGRSFGYFVFVTVGTGISYCAVVGGRPFAGHRGGALNLGTSALADGVPTLEDTASGAALARRYTELAGRASGASRAEDVLAAARRGDQAAAEVVAHGAKALGIGIALLINLLDPEAVVLGGGLGSADTPYTDEARRWAMRYVHRFAAETPVLRGALGADAGVIGAGLAGLLAQQRSETTTLRRK
ncbi:MAG TPA: ROK family protein [Streptosporangiaceae bacterium]